MKVAKVRNFLFCVFLLVVASGCASPITKSLRQEAASNVTFPMVFGNPDAYVGDTVIWGGYIIRTVNSREGSRIFILETALDYRDAPEASETSQGRFIAETAQLLDPLVYAKGRMVTVAGRVTGKKTVTHKKSGISYSYPVIQVKQLHLWAKARPAPPAYWGPYWGPYWDWDYPYYDVGFGGFEGEEEHGRGDEGREMEERGGERGEEGGHHDRR